MILGRSVSTFPRRVAIHPLPTASLASIVRRALPVVMFLEKIVHPRWHIPPDVSRRGVGIAVLIVSVLFLVPLPLIQIVPAMLVALMALAYLEEDGLLLCLSLVGAAVLIGDCSSGNMGNNPRRRLDQPDLAGPLTPSLRRLVRDQVALHEELQCTIAFHIHCVSLLALDGRENSDNGTAVRLVLVDDVADSKFGHLTFRLKEQGFR
jgi:hypothetical protein